MVFSEAMPSRRYSTVILAGSWPSSSGDDLRAAADAQGAAAQQVRQAADHTRDIGEQFMDATEGRFAAAMYTGYQSVAGWLDAKADFHDAAQTMYQGIGGDVDAAKSHFEHLDWQAHDAIEKLEAAGPVAQAEITAIVGGAHAACMAYATQTAAHIAGREAKFATAATPPAKHPNPPGSAYPGPKFQESPYIKRDHEDLVKPTGDGNGEQPVRTSPGGQPGQQTPQDAAQSPDPTGVNAGSGPDKTPVRGEGQRGSGDTPGKGPLGGNGLPGFPGVGSGGGGSGGGLGSGVGSGGGLSSGLLGGGSPLSAFQSGLGAGNPGAGLGGPGGAGLQGLSPTPSSAVGGGGGLNPVGDFARGFNAGAGTGAGSPASAGLPPLAGGGPPASGTAGASSSPVASAPTPAGPAASAGSVSPTVSPLSGMAGAAPVGAVPGTGSGASLAPVGSDVVRHVGGGAGGPATSLASSSGSGPTMGGAATASAAGGAATASMAAGPLAATQGSAAESKSTQRQDDDPVLAGAVRLVYELMHGSRFYPGLDWCVGVFASDGGTFETVVTSNEGAGYVPAGVFLPRAARLLFADPLVDDVFRQRWFGWSNPVDTMVAYAQLRRGEDAKFPLYALAASSLMDATTLSAADVAGVEHVQLCSAYASPLRGETLDQVLDTKHVHRLHLWDAELLAWLEDAERSAGEVTGRCEQLTTAAWAAVSARLGASGLIVPDAGAAVFNQLTYGDVVSDRWWVELWAATEEAQSLSGAVRPVEDSPVSVEMYQQRHDLARLLECLYWWRPIAGVDQDASIRFSEIAYCARQIEGVEQFTTGMLGGKDMGFESPAVV